MLARRIALGLFIVAGILAASDIGWIIVTRRDESVLRLVAAIVAAVALTLLRIYPRNSRSLSPPSASPTASSPLGASLPAPVDIVDR